MACVGTHYKGKPSEVRALNTYIKLLRGADSVGSRLKAQIASHGLTETQFGTLEILLHLGAQTTGELTRRQLSTGGNLTLVVDNLEKRGLVKRRRCLEDRRVVYVELTGEGRELIARIFPAHVAAITRQMSVLTAAEQDELARLCKKVGLQE
jgi:MarR family 2-MHQ and catechol resistance regulon transcriptional repressor